MTNYDVIKKLLGSIEAVGDANIDEKRYSNLEATIEVTEKLLSDINISSHDADRQEASMKKIGRFAKNFLQDMAEAHSQADNSASPKLLVDIKELLLNNDTPPREQRADIIHRINEQLRTL